MVTEIERLRGSTEAPSVRAMAAQRHPLVQRNSTLTHRLAKTARHRNSDTATLPADDAATALSHGDLTRTVPPSSRADVRASSVDRSENTLRKLDGAINRLIDAGRRGDLSYGANADGFEGASRELVLGINAIPDETPAPISEATHVFGEVARRDLTRRVRSTFVGDHGRLTSALNVTIDQLEAALSEVRVASSEVTAVAEQISA